MNFEHLNGFCRCSSTVSVALWISFLNHGHQIIRVPVLLVILFFIIEGTNRRYTMPWQDSATRYHFCCALGLCTYSPNIIHLHCHDGVKRAHRSIKDSNLECKLHGQAVGGPCFSLDCFCNLIFKDHEPWKYVHDELVITLRFEIRKKESFDLYNSSRHIRWHAAIKSPWTNPMNSAWDITPLRVSRCIVFLTAYKH